MDLTFIMNRHLILNSVLGLAGWFLTVQFDFHLSVAISSALIRWHTSLTISQGLQQEGSYGKTMELKRGTRPICKNRKFSLTLLPSLLRLELLQSAWRVSGHTTNQPTTQIRPMCQHTDNPSCPTTPNGFNSSIETIYRFLFSTTQTCRISWHISDFSECDWLLHFCIWDMAQCESLWTKQAVQALWIYRAVYIRNSR